MITEDYVSFEIAKLLKEKGFDEPCTYLWIFEKTNNPEVDDNGVYMCPLKRYTESDYWNNASIELFKKEDEYWNDNIDFFACPTLQMAMKWLREVHNIDIIINVSSKDEIYDKRKYTYVIVSKWFTGTDNVKRIYEEACEAAIKYCLKNLIKNEDKKEEPDIPVPKTVDEAISTLEKILSDEDKEYLLKNGAISMHDSLGRWIRNEWGLWTGSELKDELMNMNKGLNHPDDMSNYIIEEFIKYWNNKIWNLSDTVG